METIKRQKGISTLDLSVYIVCVALILTAGWPKISAYLEKGNRSRAISDVSLLSTAVAQYHQQTGAYPVNLEALTSASAYNGTPWILKLPAADPWGTKSSGIDGTGGTSAYAYGYTSSGFAIWSLGKDKINNSGGSGSSLPAGFGGDDVGVIGQ